MILFASFASLLSAFSALCYQSLWLRSFSLILGGSKASLSLVLAVFMAGLALGSILARRLNPASALKAYAFSEIFMALAALAVPASLRFLPLPLGGWALLPALASAAASGLTLPWLMEALERSGQGEQTAFRRLYALNCLGAALGALTYAFWLLPAFGILGSTVFAAAINFGLAAYAWRLASDLSPASGAPLSTVEKGDLGGEVVPRFILLSALSGVAAMLLELGWTRSLSLVLGSSVYAFALMLAATLAGLALGAAASWAGLGSRLKLSSLLTAGYLALALLIPVDLWVIGTLPRAYFAFLRWHEPAFGLYQAFGFGLAFFSLLPISALQGYLFPHLLRLAESEGARRDSAGLYFFNTLGCAAGALAGGLLLLPAIGIQALFSVAAGLTAFMAAQAWPASPLRRNGASALALFLGLTGALWFRPWNTLIMSTGFFARGALTKQTAHATFDDLATNATLLFYEEGPEAVVCVRGRDEERSLVINGKTDASLRGDLLTQTLLAHIPLCLNPGAKDVYVIGWGSGCSTGSAAIHPVERIECAEIEPAVFKTREFFRAINSGKGSATPEQEAPLWADPRFSMHVADARRDLARRGRAYDVIISEPSNPWISGVSNLFTLDFYALARQHLKPGGLFCQWFHYYNMDQESLRLQLRTFATAWPQVSLWMVPQKAGVSGVSGDLILLGSEQAPDLEASAVIERLESPAVSRDLLRADCCGPADDRTAPAPRDRWWFYSLLMLNDSDLRRFAGEGPLNSDDRPRLEFQAPKALLQSARQRTESDLGNFWALEKAVSDPVPDLHNAAQAQLLGRLGLHYGQRSQLHRAIRALTQAEALGFRDPRLDLQLGKAYYFSGKPAEATPRVVRAILAQPRQYDPLLAEAGRISEGGRPDLALGIFDMAVRAYPNDPKAHFGRGLCLAQMGKRSEAIRALELSLRLKPDLAPAKEILAEIQASPPF